MRLGPGLLVSILLHAGLLALALLVWPQKEREVVAGTVPVTVVSEVMAEAAPGAQPDPEPAAEIAAEAAPVEEAPPPTPAPPTPPTPAPATPAPPTPPRPTPAPQRPAPTPPRPAPTEKAPTPQPPAERPRPTPSRPQPPAREEPGLDLDAIASAPGPRPAQPRPAPGQSGQGRAPAATGPQLNAIAGQIYEHWNLNCSVAGMDELVIPIRLTLTSSGRITEGPVVVRQQPGPVFRAAAEGALRAVRAAEPFDLPGDFTTQELTLNFRTEPACRGR